MSFEFTPVEMLILEGSNFWYHYCSGKSYLSFLCQMFWLICMEMWHITSVTCSALAGILAPQNHSKFQLRKLSIHRFPWNNVFTSLVCFLFDSLAVVKMFVKKRRVESVWNKNARVKIRTYSLSNCTISGKW